MDKIRIGFLDIDPFTSEQIRSKFCEPWMDVVLTAQGTIHEADATHHIMESRLEIVHTNKAPVRQQAIDYMIANGGLGIVSDATGFDQIDFEYGRARYMPVANAIDYANRSVAEATMWHIYDLARGFSVISSAVRHGEYEGQATPFYFEPNHPLSDRRIKLHQPIEVLGKTVGLIGGSGRIGSVVADLCHANGLHVLVNDLKKSPKYPTLELEEMLPRCDFLSLHLPAGDRPIISAREVELMKQGAGLINTSRAVLVDEKVVMEGIECGKLRGYGRDVYKPEPPPKGYLGIGVFTDTGHNAFRTVESLEKLLNGMFLATVALYNRDYRHIVNHW